MRVLQVHNRYRQPGGEDAIYESEGELLAAAGSEVRRYEVTNPTRGRETVAALVRAPWNRRHAGTVRNLIRKWKPDVAHVYNTWFSLSPAVLTALRQEGVPTVALLDNYRTQCVDAGFYRQGEVCMDCLGKVPWRGVTRACYRGSRPLSAAVAVTSTLHRSLGTWASADSIVVSSEWMRSVLAQAGFAEDRMTVVPHSTPDPGPRKDPPSTSDEVVYLGRMVHNKGCLELADEWTRNAAHLGDLRLRMIGDGPQARQIDRLTSPSLLRTPWLEKSEVRSVLANARALICPSRWHEPFGLVVIEAMAAGLPVIVSDRGALPELVAGGAGSVAPIGDAQAWRDSLVRLRDDRYVDLAGKAARAEFERRFSPEVARNNLLGLYRRVTAV